MKIIEILNKLKIFKYHQIGKFSNIIVRIEFSPLVEIGVNKGHYYPEETTDEGTNFKSMLRPVQSWKLINKQVSYDSSWTSRVLFMLHITCLILTTFLSEEKIRERSRFVNKYVMQSWINKIW